MDDSDQLTRYLLGRLDETAMAALEERYFRDRELFDRMEVALDDLTDAYVRGTLSGADRQDFEVRYGTTPEGRARIAFARTLVAYQPSVAARVIPRRDSFLTRAVEVFRQGPVLVQLLAAAAMVVVVVGGPIAVWRGNRLASEVSRLRGQVQQLASAVTTERELRAGLERQLGDVSTSAFDLLPGTDRSGGITLLVPRSAGMVRLQLELESAPPPGPIRVVILTADGATLWSRVVADSSSGAAVDALVPATLFDAGEYQVRVARLRPNGQADALATYGFRMRRR